jgi:acetyltransferase
MRWLWSLVPPVPETALRPFFAPRSVAVVGASATKGKAGYFLFRNLLDGGYRGDLYAINPGAKRVLGSRAYASLTDVPGPVDLAFLVVSGQHVMPALQDCARRGVKAVTIVTAGFAEVGDQGRARQEALAGVVRQNGMRAVGPNSVGLVSAPARLMGSFVPFPSWPGGRVAIAAQTGIFTGAFADELSARSTQRIGFSRSLCLGNSIDIDEVDFLDYAARDPQTDVIAVHLESFKRARAFLSAANRIKRTKPIVVMKTGRTAEGAQAAASHSGAMAAQDGVVDAALRQYGVVRARTLDDFIGITKALAWLPATRGGRVGIVTLSGAMGVMAVDEMHGTGLTLPAFSPATVRRIARCLPEWQPVRNPADVWMALSVGVERAHAEVLGAVLGDRSVDMLLCILLPIPNTDFDGVRRVFARLRRTHPRKPIALVLVGGVVKQRWLRELEPLRLPVYTDPGAAIRALAAVRFAAEQRHRVCPDPELNTLERNQ